MDKGIDLLSGKVSRDLRWEQASHHFKKGGLIMLLIYCFVCAAVMIYWLNLNNQIAKTNRLIEAKKQGITGLKKQESLHLALKERLFFMQSVLANNESKTSEVVALVFAMDETGIETTKIELGKKEAVVFENSVDNALLVSTFLDKLKGLDSRFSTARLDKVNRQDEGNYFTTVILTGDETNSK